VDVDANTTSLLPAHSALEDGLELLELLGLVVLDEERSRSGHGAGEHALGEDLNVEVP
jgi:hypothetical protein